MDEAWKCMNSKICNINLNSSILNKNFCVEVDDDFFANAGGDIKRGYVKAEVICDRINNDSFHFNIHSVGNVFTPCDLCLDDVELRIDINDDITVMLGEEELDNGEYVVVDREKPCFNLTDIVYQFVVVSLPVKRVHEPGMCNCVMMEQFKNHCVDRSNDGQLENMNTNESDNHNYDHRWDKLKDFFK